MSHTTRNAAARGRAFADARNGSKPATAAAARPAPATAPPSKLLARLQAREPNMVAAAMRKGPPPAMFHSGAVPPALSSGANPAILNTLPEQIRHYASKAGAEEFGRLVSLYADNPDADLAVQIFEPRACLDDGWHEYRARLQSWVGCSID